MIRRKDLWWLLALPVYYVLHALRHEAGHALVGLLEGARIAEFRFLPIVDGRFRPLDWGVVRFAGEVSWLTYAGPYLGDLLTFALAFALLMKVRFRHRWVWLNLFILGLAGPLLNSFLLYICGLQGRGSDARVLMAALPAGVYHGYFVGTMTAYAAGLVVAIRRRTRQEREGTPIRSPWDHELVAVMACVCLALVLAAALYFSARSKHVDRSWLFYYVEHGEDAMALSRLLHLGTDPDCPFGQDTLLTAAIRGHNQEMVEAVLKHGADPDMRSPSKWQPILLAAYLGEIEMVKLLMAFGAETGDSELRSALLFGRRDAFEAMIEGGVRFEQPRGIEAAAAMGDVERVREILREGGDADELRKGLILAAGAGHAEIVSLLIAAGTETGEGPEYVTPLHTAAWAGDVAMAELLLDAGAPVDGRSAGFGNTPLHAAAERGHVEMVELLIARAADVNAEQPTGRPIFRAYGGPADFPAVTRALLAAGADADVMNSYDDTPLGMAILTGRVGETRALIEAGVDLEARCSADAKPLAMAAGRGLTEIVEELLAAGADPMAPGEGGATALHLAAEFGHCETVRALLAGGTAPNVRDEKRATPLHRAVIAVDRCIIQALIAAGANVDAADGQGRTPLMWAAIGERPGMIRLLLAAGAKADATDEDGCTAMEHAKRRGSRRARRVLREHTRAR